MSLYAQLSDVAALLPQVQIDAQSKPSAGVVQDFLDDEERDLNALLLKIGFVSPVTGTEAKKQLKVVVAQAAAGRALLARAAGASNAPDFQLVANSLIKGARDWVKRLADASDPLTLAADATRTGEDVEKVITAQISSHVQGLSDFDPDLPVVSRVQVF